MKRLVLAGLLIPLPLAAQDVAGEFDYYVLALSWSPSWCATEGAGRNEPQCEPERRTGFVVHGLWPQYERGWPDWCETDERDPSRRESRAMVDVMPSADMAWYQWQKHGRCSGLSGPDYYQATRQTAQGVEIPPVLRMLPRDVRLEARAIENAFIDVNPELTRDGITVTCDDGRLDEVRICLTRDLQPRDCAPDVRRDCRSRMLVEAPG
ncbi:MULTISPECIES: ribonuclease T2 [unclassified Paracoccus (in: a-proteobacteria)]|uniref:ribonuclease T2 family protein n=1 Tax=unclassified Paracoccus (in: a-proteobacteria) TaxID=2688777 RepID=UPI00160181B5|nr:MULTISPECIES: ribonuclease T2 [unclassified Paracoccus (in: a-proteobacteria)]MBB1491460.1 ribonuclease T2 [Paracoccus sp. MC1854]MBB1497656.1 ribonuclease T2 [Paracoccus sp. MC1862]QQO44096.1 ribonuclease T2 [Paracoccus sp. MC1862]